MFNPKESKKEWKEIKNMYKRENKDLDDWFKPKQIE